MIATANVTFYFLILLSTGMPTLCLTYLTAIYCHFIFPDLPFKKQKVGLWFHISSYYTFKSSKDQTVKANYFHYFYYHINQSFEREKINWTLPRSREYLYINGKHYTIFWHHKWHLQEILTLAVFFFCPFEFAEILTKDS